MKNKFLVTVIGLAMLMVFTACGKSSTDTINPAEPPSASVETITESEEPSAIPVINVPIEKPYLIRMAY